MRTPEPRGRRASRPVLLLAAVGCASGLGACAVLEPAGPPVPVRYVGSSTVAVFLRDAEPVYRRIDFEIDTAPESAGGEQAILEGRTDLAGIAANPRPETLAAGIAATLIGRDAIAVIVNVGNPISALSFAQLRAVFTGEVDNWKALGGPDLAIQPFVVGDESATSRIFRRIVLGGDAYGPDCQEIRPDRDILAAVAKTAGGVGQISFSFLNGAAEGVRPIDVDGEQPSVTNLDYPIARPLYLLRREGNSAIERFLRWTQTDTGQRVVMRHFVGTRVVGAATGRPQAANTGWLRIYTKTYPVYDGGIYYYPHRSYTILTRYGEHVRAVRNHRGDNDEHPTRVELPAGTYLISTSAPETGTVDFFVTIEVGQTRSVDVDEFLERDR